MVGPTPIAFRAFGGGSLDAYVANRRRAINDSPELQALLGEQAVAVERAREEGFQDGAQTVINLQKEAIDRTPLGMVANTIGNIAGSDDIIGDVGSGAVAFGGDVADAARNVGGKAKDVAGGVADRLNPDFSSAAAAAVGVGAFFITRTLQKDDDARAFIRATTAALVAGGLAYTQKQRLKQLPLVGWLF